MSKEKERIILQIAVSAQPIHLGGQVAVDYIAFIVLEAPGGYDQGVSLPDPNPFLDLTLDSSHAGNPVSTPHTDVIRTHHQLCHRKLLTVPSFGQTYTKGRGAFV